MGITRPPFPKTLSPKRIFIHLVGLELRLKQGVHWLFKRGNHDPVFSCLLETVPQNRVTSLAVVSRNPETGTPCCSVSETLTAGSKTEGNTAVSVGTELLLHPRNVQH